MQFSQGDLYRENLIFTLILDRGQRELIVAR